MLVVVSEEEADWAINLMRSATTLLFCIGSAAGVVGDEDTGVGVDATMGDWRGMRLSRTG